MEIVDNKVTKNKRIYALVTLIIMILNLFSPYGELINTVFAAPATGEPYYRLTLLKPSDNPDPDAEDIDDATYYYYYDYMNGTVDTPEEEQSRAIVMELSIEGCNSVNSADIYFRWNTDKFVAGQTTKPTRKGTPYLEAATEYTNNSKYPDADFGITNWGSPVYEILDASAGTLRFTGGIATGSSYLTSGTVVGQFLFLLKDGVTIDDITTDDISLVTGAVGLEQGLQIAYFPDGKTAYHTDGKDYLLFSGFSAGEKQISSVELKTSPTKTQYYVGETLDFTDGELTVKYDDGSEENISIADAISSGKLTTDSTVATNSKKVTLTYDSETVDFEYYVLDSITVSKNLNKMNYEHGDTIEFAGGELTATYKNSAGASTTKVLNIQNEIVAGNLTANKTTADVDNKTITFTYFDNKTASMNLTVTDPIASISITKQPNLLTYDDGETINLAGGQITPVTKSGKTLTTVATNASTVTSSTTTASIAQATNKWTIAGGDGLQAGNQKITLTYEGKTADITIVVNDTVSGVSITTQATAENKYGTPAGALNFNGLVATITTTGGGTFTVGASSLTIDTTAYNPNSVAKQLLPVKYGTISSTNNAEITLSNYITGISVNFTQTEFEYGTELGDVLAKGTYVENYADGTTSSPKAITSDMVTGYVASPAATLLTNHKYNETLTIKLSTSTNSFDQLPAVATQVITLKDVPVSIDVASKPNKISYNYGETFLTNGGQIKVNYKSGASQNISMGANTVTLTETDGSNINMSPAVSEFVNGKVTKTIKVNYTADGKTFDTSFDITIKDSVDSIAITTNPKLVFEHNETFDASTGKLTVTYKSGNSEVVSLDEANLTENDGSTVNMAPTVSEYTDNQLTKTLKVEYAGLTTNYNITLKNTVASITVTAPTKVSYNLNESIDFTGGKVTVTRKAGDTKDLALTDTKVTVTNFDTSVAGTGKTANVKYTEEGKDYIGTFTYDVVNNITDISITVPTKTDYEHGDTLDLTGGKITLTYADTTTQDVNLNTTMVTENGGSVNMNPASGEYVNNVLTKNLTITYNAPDGQVKSTTYVITLKNTIDKIDIATPPKTNYNLNDSTASAGGTIKVTRKAGNTEIVNIEDSMITNLDTTTAGTSKTATVTYTEDGKNYTTTYNYSVKDNVTGIVITVPTDVTFNHGDALTFTGGDIEVSYAGGSKAHPSFSTATIVDNTTGSAVNMSPLSSEYDSNNEKSVTIKVTYTEDGVTKDETYTITIKNNVKTIAMGTIPTKTKYNLNDTTYDLTNIAGTNGYGDIIVTRAAGNAQTIALNDSKVTLTELSTLTTTGGTKNVTVEYEGKTTTFEITVENGITNAEITVPTKTAYEHGDMLDLTGGKVTLTYADTTTQEVNLSTTMVTENGGTVNMSPAVSEYNINNEVTKTLTIEYTPTGWTNAVTKTYNITLKNTVDNITVTAPTKVTYNLNESADLTGGKVVVTRKAGNTQEIALTDATIVVTNFDTTTTGANKTATVTYTEDGNPYIGTFKYDVIDSIISISIIGSPKTNYELNEPLEDLEILVTKNSGATETISVTPDMISGFDSSTEGTKTITITYEGKTETITVTVKDSIDNITIGTMPKKNYLVGEPLDVTGGTIKVTKKSGAIETVNITPDMVSGFNSSSEVIGQVLTITYEGKTTTYIVNITDSISNITLNPGPTKTTYKYGEPLDLTGASIDIVKANGDTDKKQVDMSMVSGYNPTPAAGTLPSTQTITVIYGKDTSGNDVKTTFTVTVEDYIESITVNGAKVEYKYNDSLDLSIGTLNITMASGTPTTPINLNSSDVTVTGYTSTTIGSQTLNVNYKGKSTTYTVEVKDYITNTKIIVPTKTTYNYGDSLDLSTGKIIKTWASGAADTVLPLEDSMVKEADGSNVNMMPSSFAGNNKVQKMLVITYEGITENYKIEIVNDVKSISIKETPKTDYNYGDSIDKTIGSIEVIRANGTKEEVQLTDSRITIDGFDTSAPLNNVPVTIKFTENGVTKSETYTINVNDNITSIQLVGTPKTTYKYGESLDLSGLTLTVVRPSGTTQGVAITQNMISGYNPNKLGDQTVTITYGGKTQNFIVKVEDYLKDIEFIKPTKVNYKLNESLDLTGASITEVYASGAKKTGINVTKSMVSNLDSSTVGTKTLTVTYTKEGKNFVKQFVVIVADGLSTITVKTFPKDEYLYGEELDLTGATIEVETESGDKQVIPITKDMISGYVVKPESSRFGNTGEYIQVITISYTKDGVTKKTSYPITTKDYFDKIKVEGLETKYTYGEDLKLANAKVSKVSASGIISDTTALTKDMISGYNSKKEGNQELTITYAGKTTKQIVSVVDNILAISINSNPTKTTYNYNTSIDLSGAKLNVIKNSGIMVIDITKDMISGYNARKVGVQTITVTYAGFTAEFTVTVNAKPTTVVTPGPQEPNTTTPTVDEPVVDETQKPDQSEIEKPAQSETQKPTATLGEKDQKEEVNFDTTKMIAGAIGILGLIFLIILLVLRRKNVEIYVDNEEDIDLVGKEKLLGEDNEKLDLTKYVEKYSDKALEIVFRKSLSKALDKKTVIMKLSNDKEIKITVKYNKEEFITEITPKMLKEKIKL